MFGPSGLHFVKTLAAGLDAAFALVDFPMPGGLPTGTWTVEATLLEVELGKTFSRDVRPFQVVP